MQKSIFIRLLGSSPTIKILDFLLADREFGYSKKEIAESSEISYNTLNSIWPYLKNNGIVVKTRKVGKQEMSKLGSESRYVKNMITLFNFLIKSSIEEAKESQTIPA